MTTAGVQRRALVTGGSGDIGAAVCRRLAADGHFVYIHAHRGLPAAQALAAELNHGGPRAEAVGFDVTDGESTRATLERLVAAHPIQILVNGAGIYDDAPFPGMSAEQWHRVLAVSLNGFFNVTRPLTMPMVRSRWGRIVCVSSVAALIGNRGQVNYAAAKGGLIAASRSLALELATRGITVNCVAPGIIAGRMSENAFDAERVRTLVPMQRVGSPDDVAAAVAFLVSESAGYITGQTLGVNGGMV